MKNYNLNIADYIIRFESGDDGPELGSSERFLRNICTNERQDVLIRVHGGRPAMPHAAKRVFNAPYVEEIDGSRVKKSDRFWSVSRHQDDLYIRTVFPLSSSPGNAILKFSLTSVTWDLWIENSEDKTDPMEYPLDGLILYYLTVIHGDIMIHASGINTAGRGYLFSGISGKGKSTIARLWNDSGATIIHDDRLIIRIKDSKYVMHNTPVYNDDSPGESPLDRIYLIEHGRENEVIPVKGASAVSLVMANCIQHNWDRKIISGLLGSVSSMCARIPVAKLLFRPDRSITDHIIRDEQGE